MCATATGAVHGGRCRTPSVRCGRPVRRSLGDLRCLGAYVTPDEWFIELTEQGRRLSETLDRSDPAPSPLRRIVQVALDSRWQVEAPGRYADTLGRLAELGFDEVSVHWPRPDGLGVPADALNGVLAAHGL